MDKFNFKEREQQDYQKLVNLNNKHNFFTSIQHLEDGYHCDASGYTTNKLGETREFIIELKDRNLSVTEDNTLSGTSMNGHSYTADTVYIEASKMSDLLLEHIVKGYEPLYVNFLDNATIIFNLKNLKHLPKLERPQIHSNGYGWTARVPRYALSMRDAVIIKS